MPAQPRAPRRQRASLVAKALPKPFKYRGGWRAQAACKNGTRPHDNFARYELAKAWMVEALANINRAHEPELGSPTQANPVQDFASASA